MGLSKSLLLIFKLLVVAFIFHSCLIIECVLFSIDMDSNLTADNSVEAHKEEKAEKINGWLLFVHNVSKLSYFS